MTTVAPFKNQHLSYSRLSRFETCPLSYRLHYIEKKQAEPGALWIGADARARGHRRRRGNPAKRLSYLGMTIIR